MDQKIASTVKQVRLTGDVLGGECFEPTLINFFYGRNGSGKSTIANQIGQPGITDFGVMNSEGYEILRYDEAFITQNVQSYARMQGVFTITQEDAADKAMLDQAISDRKQEKNGYEKAMGDLSTLAVAKEKQESTARTTAWRETEQMRKAWPETQAGYKTDRSKFFGHLLDVKPADCDIEKIKELYNTAYQGAGKEYEYYPCIQSAELPTSSLLEKRIVSSGSTPFADFVKVLNNLAWIEHGHSNYQGERCPYCQQILPETFEEDLASCYDAAYQQDMQGLQEFLSEYNKAFMDIYRAFSRGLNNEFDSPQVEQYRDKLNLLKAAGARNLESISRKIRDPFDIVVLEDIGGLLSNLTATANEINGLIEENNNRIKNIDKAKIECTNLVWGKLAYCCQATISNYQVTMRYMSRRENEFKEEIEKHSEKMRELDGVIAQLNAKTTNTTAVMERINKMLEQNGFQGFHLREDPNTRYVYQLVRENGEIAKGLSEAERHIISFLYFYHLVTGSQSEAGVRKDKIVIIDDPVSSMDSTSMALVAQLVRNMVSICYNNFDLDRADGSDDYIKQFFCLTHNPYFFKEITYNKIADYECVSLYELKKGGGKPQQVNSMRTGEACSRRWNGKL